MGGRRSRYGVAGGEEPVAQKKAPSKPVERRQKAEKDDFEEPPVLKKPMREEREKEAKNLVDRRNLKRVKERERQSKLIEKMKAEGVDAAFLYPV